MDDYKFLPAGNSAALDCAASILRQTGFCFVDAPGPEVTHLLLPVPSFESTGCIKGGVSLQSLLDMLPENVHILGGNLGSLPEGYACTDLLKDPTYVAKNAAITAHCAIGLAMQKLPVTLEGLPVLVIGWGRIGKCLAKLLKALGADVTVAARKESDRAMLRALGYRTAGLPFSGRIPTVLAFNTVPAQVDIDLPPQCLKIDLASVKGLPGKDVIWARGLPGKDTPVSSGELIAETITSIITGKE